MKALLIYCLLLSILCLPPLEFSDYITFFIEGDKKIPSNYRKKFLETGLNCSDDDCPEFIAKEFLFERPDKTMMVYEMSCGAGGICVIQNIVVYDRNEKLVGRYPFYVEMADCSFHNLEKATFISDSLLYYSSVKELVDCSTEKVTNREITLTEVELTNHPFKKSVIKIDETRRYWIASTQLLDENYLNRLSSDSLDYIRNEIFASKGYEFKTKKWKNEFEKTTWYKPTSKSGIELSTIEQINVKRLLEKKNK